MLGLADRRAAEGGAGTPGEVELPLRLLRHYTSSVRRQQYHDTDVVAVRVDASPLSRNWEVRRLAALRGAVPV